MLYAALFDFMGIFCHQMPERSWILFGVQAPLCIRCSALLLGALVAAGYVLLRYPLPGWRFSVLLASPLLLDVGTRLVGLQEGNNSSRFATGLAFGFFSVTGSLKWLAEFASSRGKNSTAVPTR